MTELKPCPFCGGESTTRSTGAHIFPWTIITEHDQDCILAHAELKLFFTSEEECNDMWGTRTPPKVKSLVWWTPSASNNYTHGAKTIFGTYYVGTCGGRYNGHAEFFHETGRIEHWCGNDRGNLYQAQQDAQDHYETRILSALETT